MYGIRKWVNLVARGKRKKQQILQLISIVMFAYIFSNCLTTWVYYQNYNNSMNILAEIATKSGQDGVDIVIDILKDNNLDSIEQGKQLLENYGYLKNVENVLYQQFLQNIAVTAGGTFFLFVILFSLLWLWQRMILQKDKARFLQIENTLVDFRENNYEVILELDDEDEQEKIKYQLDVLGHYMKLLKEEARLEKEGTKELVSDISHQLKTPVAALDACFSVLLRDNLSEEEQKEFRIRCRNALDGLEVLLQSLLQISKMEVGLIQIDKKNLSLLETIITAVNRVYPNAIKKDIELVFDFDETLENYKIMQDKKWLSEALINILDNAIKYSPTHSEIAIRLQKRTGIVRIEIEDQGIGIPKEEYHKVFQRFFRGSLPEVKEESGSGIGLFLSREIIEQHHGTITVSSNFDMEVGFNHRPGSKFLIQLLEKK